MGTNTLSILTGHSNTDLLHDVMDAYSQYKRNEITRGQYDYRRQKALKELKRALGPTERLLFKGLSAQEAIRIQRSRALPATSQIRMHSMRLSRLSRVIGHGGTVILGTAGLALACHEIGETDDHHEQNEIFVESVGGFLSGAMAGAVIVAMLVTGPVGIVAALAISSASAVAGWGAGQAAKTGFQVYSSKIEKIDLLGPIGIRDLCH